MLHTLPWPDERIGQVHCKLQRVSLRRCPYRRRARRLCEHAWLTGDQVAEHVGWPASKVSRIENARTAPGPAEIRKLLALYGVEGGSAEGLLTLAKKAASKGVVGDLLADASAGVFPSSRLEAEARSASRRVPLIVSGILQTTDYTGEVSSWYLERIAPVPPSETKRRVEAWLAPAAGADLGRSAPADRHP